MTEIKINNPANIQQDFYNNYNPDYWLYKASLLKNSHDNYKKLREKFTNGDKL